MTRPELNRDVDPSAGCPGRAPSATGACLIRTSLIAAFLLLGLVTAAAHGIPGLGIAYDPKVQSFCCEMGYPYCFPARVHEETTREDLRRLWQDRREVIDVAVARRTAMLARLKIVEERFDELW